MFTMKLMLVFLCLILVYAIQTLSIQAFFSLFQRRRRQ